MKMQDIIFKTLNEDARRTKLIIIQAIKQNNFSAMQIADLFQLFATKVESEVKEQFKKDIIEKIKEF